MIRPCHLARPLFLAWMAACLCSHALPAQSTVVPPIIADAVKYQLEDFHHTAWGLRYHVRRTDSKGVTERDLVESRDGNVARTISRQGKPLTAEEDAAERARLEGITATDMARRKRQSETSDKFGVELIGALPQAMLFTPAAEQHQLPHAEHAQAVFDFAPNPSYHPSTTSQQLLPCIAGHVWIDTETHHLVRIEINVTRNVNLMMGILARVYSGGTLAYEQHPAGDGHYAYSDIDIDVRLRELMVKTVPYHSTFVATNVTFLPAAPGYQEAIRMLLARP